MPSKRILIADDAMDFSRMLQATLATVDPAMKVALVPSGEEAMLETARLSPELLVTDIRLPGISGIELVKKVHKRYPNLRIIVITGLKDPGLEEKVIQARADRFFTKPLSIGDFIAAVEELLQMPPSTPPVVQPEPSAQVPSPDPNRLTDLITGLRRELGALVVLLVDDRGHAVARAGDFPDASFEAQAVPDWMAVLSASDKPARRMGPEAESVLAFRSKELEIVLAPVGEMGLVIGLKPGRSVMRLALAVEEALLVQKELLAVIAPIAVARPRGTGKLVLPTTPAEVPVVIETAAPEPAAAPEPVEEPADLGDLEAIFAVPVKAPSGQELDDFWEKAAASTGQEVASPDVLTYEQAQRLGLAPENGGGA